MTQPSNVASLEFYSLAASEPNKPRNFLWSADVNINASLHLSNEERLECGSAEFTHPLHWSERERERDRERECGPAEFLCLHHLHVFTVQREREKEGRRGRKRERENCYFKRNGGCLGTFQLSSIIMSIRKLRP